MIEPHIDESFEIIKGRKDAGLVLICDHARNNLPPDYGTLGLDPAQFKRHIAYDIGMEAITRQMAAALGVPAVLSKFSRLLIDPNRGTDDPTLIMRISDGAVVPGNRHVDEAERQRRVTRYYTPYHNAIDQVVESCLATKRAPALLSMHSFTQSWKGRPRPWHVAVLWDADARLPHALLDALRQDKALVVGDNEPYTGNLTGDTMWQHGTQRNLAHAIIEVRQDLIGDEAGQELWARRFVAIMNDIMSAPQLASVLAG